MKQRELGSIGPAIIALTVAVSGCDAGGGGGGGQGKMPPEGRLVQIAGGNVEVGFKIGVIRESRTVGSFVISRYPVTRGEFAACVKAGACQESAEPRCSALRTNHPLDRSTITEDKLPDDAPATCVGLDQAEKYCSWTGGRVPTFEEWLLANRGASVMRHAWGDTEATCAQHPRAVDRNQLDPCGSTDTSIFQVGKHSAGASPFGLEDSLLAPAELLRLSSKNVFGACESAGTEVPVSEAACVVYGMEPGAIDAVQRIERQQAKTPDTKGPPDPEYPFTPPRGDCRVISAFSSRRPGGAARAA